MPAAAVVLGRVVTFDPQQPVLEHGAVYVSPDGLIAAVTKAGAKPPDGFADARRIDTHGVIYPGLVDLHGHIAYNALPLWSPPDRTEPYTSRYQWPGNTAYKTSISDPTNLLGRLAGKALLKYGEVKALVGGSTAIQGSAKMSRPYEGWLVHNVEYETFGTGVKSVYQSALPLRTDADYETEREHMTHGAAFIYHLSEGTDPALIAEYRKLRDEHCLQPTLGAIHCTALDGSAYADWGGGHGSIIWSPFSNVWLYRATTHVDEAKAAGIRVCLGADWSPSGSKNLLGELKVADLWNREHLNSAFTDQELCEMATCNPADALNWSNRLGRLKTGLSADLLVVADRLKDPYRNLIESIEGDVRLVLVGGRRCYGTANLMRDVPNAEPIKVGRFSRRVVLKEPEIPDADMSWAEVVAALEAVRANPNEPADQARRAFAAGEPPLMLLPDKPWDLPSEPEEELVAAAALPTVAAMPPLDSLTHDAAYFRAVDASPLHGGLLGGLKSYYRRR